MSSDMSVEESSIRDQIARRIAEEGLEPLQTPRFLTTDDRVLNIFVKVGEDSKGNIIPIIPKDKETLHSVMTLLNSHLCRTGSMTEKEAHLYMDELEALFLMLQAEHDEDSYEGETWALYEALRLHLEGAVRDNIQGWRGKLLTVKEWYAHITGTGTKKKGLLGGLFGK